MLDNLIGRFPTYGILVCAILTVLIPLAINKINHKLHQLGDPPWKKTNK